VATTTAATAATAATITARASHAPTPPPAVRRSIESRPYQTAPDWTRVAPRAIFLDRLEALVGADRLVVHRVTDDQEAAAWAWLRRRDEREYSFVDASSFRVMRDRRLREALAFDGDFATAGFVEVRPGP
jgi:hypothetical protein